MNMPTFEERGNGKLDALKADKLAVFTAAADQALADERTRFTAIDAKAGYLLATAGLSIAAITAVAPDGVKLVLTEAPLGILIIFGVIAAVVVGTGAWATYLTASVWHLWALPAREVDLRTLVTTLAGEDGTMSHSAGILAAANRLRETNNKKATRLASAMSALLLFLGLSAVSIVALILLALVAVR